MITLNIQAQTFVQEATYSMGDDDSKISAKNKAIMIAKRECIEQAGVYMSSYSKSVQGLLKNDVIESFSASLMKVSVLEQKFRYPSYWVKIQADIDVDLLNKKIRQFTTSSAHVDDQIQRARDEIEQYNDKLEKLIQTRSKKKQLKILQEKKRILIQKVNKLANNKSIQIKSLENKDYAYVNIRSNIENSEIYVDGEYVGIAPILRLKIPTQKEIEIKGVNDKRYYPKDVIVKKSYKKLSMPNINLEFKKGEAELFFVGKNNATVYVNDIVRTVLNPNNRTIKVKADASVNIGVSHANGCYVTNEELWANNTYEIIYTLDESECSLINHEIIHKGDIYEAVISPYTGKVWLDRNLGAKRVCNSFDDESCYGDYFQWGRDSDGHEKLYSTNTKIVSRLNTPVHSEFILSSKKSEYNWLKNRDDELWQGVNGINNPCPATFRVPTIDELLRETKNEGVKNRYGAYEGFLKLPSASFRYRNDGLITKQGRAGDVWSSSVDGKYARYLHFNSNELMSDVHLRANGCSVRCIKESLFE